MPTTDVRGIRRSASSSSGGVQSQFNSNEFDEQIVSQGMPPFAEMSRLGNGYTVMTATATAPIAAVPTTTARLEVFNNSAGVTPVVLVITDLFAFQLLSTAATQTYGIWAMVTTQKAAPTNTALTLASVSGRAAIATTSGGSIITAVDTTVVANGWRPWGPVQAWGTAAATPGNSLHAPVDGKLMVPAGASLCIVAVGSIATASSFHVGCTFYTARITAIT